MKKHLKANIWLWIASALLVIVVAGFLIIPRNGREFEVDGICYKVVDDISNIVAVTSRGDSYDTYADEYVGAVVIPDNITRIENAAFQHCSAITSVNIPNSVEFMDSAFGYATNALPGSSSCTVYNNCYYLGNETNPYICLYKA